MPLLAVRNLTKTFAERVLFEGLSFEVSEGDRIGFVGVNGCGKSTLFHIITGEESRDSGDIYLGSDTIIGSVAQNVPSGSISLYDYTLEVFSEVQAVEKELEQINDSLIKNGADKKLINRQSYLNEQFNMLDGLTYKNRTAAMLTGLGFSPEEQKRSISSFSGGQRNKAQLARLLLSNANLLLLDEPTNHLDIGAVEWLENFLSAYKGSFIVISHDRYFLDRVTNKTMELKDGRLYNSKCNYSGHIELRSTAKELERRHYMRTKKEIKRIESIVEQQRRWGQEHNFITAASKQKQADKLKATLVKPENESASVHFNFTAKETGGNDVIVGRKLSKSFDGKQIFSNVDLLIKKGEKVFLLGDNGCGKTTLLNILSGRMRPSSGSYYLGSHIECAYYEQTISMMDPEHTVLEEAWDKYYTVMTRAEICNALAAFLFRGEDVEKPVAKLSGGEAARLQLLKMMLTRANLLLLDEPTNHLDIASREALENALENYDGTMLVVTHDRYLINRLADRVLHMTKDGLKEYIGGYEDYLKARAENAEEKAAHKPSESQNAVDYRERKEHQSALNRAKGRVSRIEKAIAEAEQSLENLNNELALPHIASDYKKAAELSKKGDEIKENIDDLYLEWGEAEEELEELEQPEDEE